MLNRTTKTIVSDSQCLTVMIDYSLGDFMMSNDNPPLKGAVKGSHDPAPKKAPLILAGQKKKKLSFDDEDEEDDH